MTELIPRHADGQRADRWWASRCLSCGQIHGVGPIVAYMHRNGKWRKRKGSRKASYVRTHRSVGPVVKPDPSWLIEDVDDPNSWEARNGIVAIAKCPDVFHAPIITDPLPLASEGWPKMRPEVTDRAAATRRLNRQRQGKASR